jgi:putative transposase
LGNTILACLGVSLFYHIHLILQPTTKEGLQKALKPLHMRYSQYINKQQNITGIL